MSKKEEYVEIKISVHKDVRKELNKIASSKGVPRSYLLRPLINAVVNGEIQITTIKKD